MGKNFNYLMGNILCFPQACSQVFAGFAQRASYDRCSRRIRFLACGIPGICHPKVWRKNVVVFVFWDRVCICSTFDKR